MHAAEKETEATFSSTKYALSGYEATTFTHISSQRQGIAINIYIYIYISELVNFISEFCP